MKISYKLIILFFCLSQPSIAQSIFSKTEFTNLICKRWKMTGAQVGNMKVSPSELGENFMTFKANETYQVIDQGQHYLGKWSFDPSKQELLTDDRDGHEKYKIIILSDKRLTIQSTDEDIKMIMEFTNQIMP